MKNLLTLACLLAFATLSAQGPIKVEVVKNGNSYQLLRGGKPYYVNGAGGHEHLDELIERGGNSVRTWSTDDAIEILDAAHKRGISVMMGLWVGHERHGFDYDDEKAIAKQLEGFRKKVMAIKDHPALLFWGIGNEVDLNYTNTKVWHAIEDIAKMIHEVDPNHPTSTVTAGLDGAEVELILERCPSIDIYCVNTYGDIGNVPSNIKKFGWTGPYMITEWGPNGHWEVSKTSWGAPIEQTSTEKKESYRSRYEQFIAQDKTHCLGSYVFLWGQKQETTATWYGLFTAEGKPTEAMDALNPCWQGSAPKNPAPTITALSLNDKSAKDNIQLSATRRYACNIEIQHPNPNKLKYTWSIIPESTTTGTGGDKEQAPQAMIGLVKKRKSASAVIKAPDTEGAYRLFIFVEDDNKKVAYANIPFYVMPGNEGEMNTAVRLKRAEDPKMIGPVMPQ